MAGNTGSARYEGLGKDGKGFVSTQSGALADQPYGFAMRFGDEPGTNPEELIGAAHASCFTMALSLALDAAGYKAGTLDTDAEVTLVKDGDGFKITKSALTLRATVPGITSGEFQTIAAEAKAGCPVSKLLNAEITLEASLSE